MSGPDYPFTMMDMLQSIRPLLDGNTCELGAIMLAPSIHAVHDVPFLRSIKDSSRDVCNGSYLLASQRYGAIEVCVVGPAPLRTDLIKFICEFHV